MDNNREIEGDRERKKRTKKEQRKIIASKKSCRSRAKGIIIV